MKKFLILVKHSLPQVEESVPAREWHLSEEGILRAERLAKSLISYPLDGLISSIEPKAKETAEIIATLYHLDVQVIENLHEHDRRNAPYLSKADFQKSIRDFFSNPDMLIFGDETANQAYSRFYKAVQSLLETHKDKTIAIVSHGTVISLFVSRVLGISDYSLWKELGLPSFLVLDMISGKLIAQENIP